VPSLQSVTRETGPGQALRVRAVTLTNFLLLSFITFLLLATSNNKVSIIMLFLLSACGIAMLKGFDLAFPFLFATIVIREVKLALRPLSQKTKVFCPSGRIRLTPLICLRLAGHMLATHACFACRSRSGSVSADYVCSTPPTLTTIVLVGRIVTALT